MEPNKRTLSITPILILSILVGTLAIGGIVYLLRTDSTHDASTSINNSQIFSLQETIEIQRKKIGLLEQQSKKETEAMVPESRVQEIVESYQDYILTRDETIPALSPDDSASFSDDILGLAFNYPKTLGELRIGIEPKQVVEEGQEEYERALFVLVNNSTEGVHFLSATNGKKQEGRGLFYGDQARHLLTVTNLQEVCDSFESEESWWGAKVIDCTVMTNRYGLSYVKYITPAPEFGSPNPLAVLYIFKNPQSEFGYVALSSSRIKTSLHEGEIILDQIMQSMQFTQ